ncbi:MAG: hypothetical protein OXR66_06555 [Candidatus Woesearchaeota archaeon]|nr:hypothetical protein [Candidatus Woesearchaeota archaeon]
MKELEVKRTMRKKQPKFIRHDTKHKKLAKIWRKPKGLHNKVGDNRRGYLTKMSTGWQTPRAVRGMTLAGLLPTRVVRVEELTDLDAKKHCVVVGKVGGKRRIAIIEAASKAGLTIMNGSLDTVKELQEKFEQQTKEKKERSAEKEKKAKAAAAKEKESLEDKAKEEAKTAEKKEEKPTPKKETPKAGPAEKKATPKAEEKEKAPKESKDTAQKPEEKKAAEKQTPKEKQ